MYCLSLLHVMSFMPWLRFEQYPIFVPGFVLLKDVKVSVPQ